MAKRQAVILSVTLDGLTQAETPGDTTGTSHHRIRRDTIDKAGVVTLRHGGRLHHIGVGRAHAKKAVVLLVVDLDIRVVDATTGELLRALTLDPTRDYQAQK